jgi:hypothetical protein
LSRSSIIFGKPMCVWHRARRSVPYAAGSAVSEQSYYRWRKEYGGLKVEQARRLKDLEQENARLKRAVAELTLDKLILKEAAEGNW